MGGGKEGVSQSEGSVDNPTREGKGAVRYVEEGSPKGRERSGAVCRRGIPQGNGKGSIFVQF